MFARNVMPHSRPDVSDLVDHISALRAFSRTFVRNPVEADDLVQETLVKAIAKYDQFETGTRMKSWLFTIMRNTYYNKVKIAGRESPGTNDCVATLPSTPGSQDWSLRAHELRDAIDRLPPNQRDLVVYVGVVGASYHEAAKAFGCDIGTVKSRLSRSRLRLLREMGESTVRSFLT
jgi:RNA polymerase sigma-70 factor (ECF subfamily)